MSKPLRKHLTIRNLPPDVALALEKEKERRENSLNQTVVDLLRVGLGLLDTDQPTNGLEKLAGGWTDDDLEMFERNTAVFGQIDHELWT